MRKQRQQTRTTRKSGAKGVQVLPVPLSRQPNSPPTINKNVYVTRRFRHIIPAGGTSTTYSLESATIDTDFGVPGVFAITSVSAWSLPNATVDTVSLSITDVESSRLFNDTAQIGQPAAKCGYRFGDHARIAFRDPAAQTTIMTTFGFTAGAEVVIDVVCEVLQA